jgi:hypothetical protein
VALSAAGAVAEVFVGPDTTVFRVAGFRLLQVFSEYLGTTGSCPAAMSAQSPDP